MTFYEPQETRERTEGLGANGSHSEFERFIGRFILDSFTQILRNQQFQEQKINVEGVTFIIRAINHGPSSRWYELKGLDDVTYGYVLCSRDSAALEKVQGKGGSVSVPSKISEIDDYSIYFVPFGREFISLHSVLFSAESDFHLGLEALIKLVESCDDLSDPGVLIDPNHIFYRLDVSNNSNNPQVEKIVISPVLATLGNEVIEHDQVSLVYYPSDSPLGGNLDSFKRALAVLMFSWLTKLHIAERGESSAWARIFLTDMPTQIWFPLSQETKERLARACFNLMVNPSGYNIDEILSLLTELRQIELSQKSRNDREGSQGEQGGISEEQQDLRNVRRIEGQYGLREVGFSAVLREYLTMIKDWVSGIFSQLGLVSKAISPELLIKNFDREINAVLEGLQNSINLDRRHESIQRLYDIIKVFPSKNSGLFKSEEDYKEKLIALATAVSAAWNSVWSFENWEVVLLLTDHPGAEENRRVLISFIELCSREVANIVFQDPTANSNEPEPTLTHIAGRIIDKFPSETRDLMKELFGQVFTLPSPSFAQGVALRVGLVDEQTVFEVLEGRINESIRENRLLSQHETDLLARIFNLLLTKSGFAEKSEQFQPESHLIEKKLRLLRLASNLYNRQKDDQVKRIFHFALQSCLCSVIQTGEKVDELIAQLDAESQKSQTIGPELCAELNAGEAPFTLSWFKLGYLSAKVARLTGTKFLEGLASSLDFPVLDLNVAQNLRKQTVSGIEHVAQFSRLSGFLLGILTYELENSGPLRVVTNNNIHRVVDWINSKIEQLNGMKLEENNSEMAIALEMAKTRVLRSLNLALILCCHYYWQVYELGLDHAYPISFVNQRNKSSVIRTALEMSISSSTPAWFANKIDIFLLKQLMSSDFFATSLFRNLNHTSKEEYIKWVLDVWNQRKLSEYRESLKRYIELTIPVDWVRQIVTALEEFTGKWVDRDQQGSVNYQEECNDLAGYLRMIRHL